MSDGTIAIGTINVTGDFSQTSGTISVTSTGPGAIVFNKAGTQTYTSGGTISSTINFTVNSGSTLQMGTGASPSTITGAGTFTLSSGATLGVTSPNGIVAVTGTLSGNIQTTVGRTFTSGANYIYNGTSSQAAGTGLTQNTPANLTIDNSAGVSLSAATTISGLLTMNNGTLNMANVNLTVGSLTGSGNLTHSSGTAGARTLTIGSDNTSPAAYTGVISNGTATSVALSKGGSGTLILSGTNTFTGGTSVSAGTLKLTNVAALGAAGAALTLTGGTLDLATDGSVTAYKTTVNGTATIVSDRATTGAAITHTLGTLSIGSSDQLNVTVGGNVPAGLPD